MKTTKRVLAYLIVAMMIVAMLPSAFADGYALTITNTTTAGNFYGQGIIRNPKLVR